MATDADRLEEIEAKATFAVQLANITFRKLVNSGSLENTEANLLMEDAIRMNRKGNSMHQKVARQFELLRGGLWPMGQDVPPVE
jgi:hypothetical protein